MVTQTNTNYNLLVLCVTCEQRPLVYHEKQRPLVSRRKMFMCPYDKSTKFLSLKFAFFLFHQKPQIEVVTRADVSENRLPETKNNFSDYDVSQSTPSESLSVPSCSLGLRISLILHVARAYRCRLHSLSNRILAKLHLFICFLLLSTISIFFIIKMLVRLLFMLTAIIHYTFELFP